MKSCSRCSQSKPIGEFHKSSEAKCGRASQCKKCDNARRTEWYRKKSVELGKSPQIYTLLAKELRAIGMKQCPKCKEKKKIESFYEYTDSGKRASYCIVCTSEYQKTLPKNKPTEARRKQNRNNLLLRKYKVTLEDYERMLQEQDGKCAICEEVNFDRSLAVDHDHVTGAVRQLLCSKCNIAIGFLRENPRIARNVATYLERHGKT